MLKRKHQKNSQKFVEKYIQSRESPLRGKYSLTGSHCGKKEHVIMNERSGYKENKGGKLVTCFGCLLRSIQTIFIKTWKYSVSDTILSHWLGVFTAAHKCITINLNTVMKEPEEIPEWLTTGTLPKSGYSKEVSNYRQITCLATICTTLTEITAR